MALGGTAINMKTPSEIAQEFTLMGEKALAASQTDPGVLALGALSGLFLNSGMNLISKGLNTPTGENEQAAFGGKVGSNVELEGKELGQLPSGETFEVKGPSHEKGGVDITLPEGTDVFSKRIKIDGKSMADRKKKRQKKSKTFEELLAKNKNDALVKNSVDRFSKVSEKENNFDVQLQNVIKTLEEGDKSKEFATGGTIPPTDYLSMYPWLDPANNQNYGLNTSSLPTPEYFNYTNLEDGNLFSGLKASEVQPYLDRLKGYKNDRYSNLTYDFSNPSSEDLKQFGSAIGLSEKDADGKFGQKHFDALKNYVGNLEVQNFFENFGSDKSNFFDQFKTADNDIPNVLNKSLTGEEVVPGGLNKYGELNSEGLPSEGDNSEKGEVLKNLLKGITGGNAVGSIGTLASAFGPFFNTNKNRQTDTPNVNPYKGYGQKALDKIDESKKYIDELKASQLNDLQLNRNAQHAQVQGNTRSVNTLRSLKSMVEAQTNKASIDIDKNFAASMMETLAREGSVLADIDDKVMTGEAARDMADRQDKDAFYSNRAKDITNMGEGLQNLGKMFNKNREINNNLELLETLKQEGFDNNAMMGIYLELLKARNPQQYAQLMAQANQQKAGE